MAERDYVRDLAAVKELTSVLIKNEEVINSMGKGAKNLAGTVSQIADEYSDFTKSGKLYSEQNKNIAKTNSKIGKDIIKVLKFQQSGNKNLARFSKLRLMSSRLFLRNQNNTTKELVKQYKSQQAQNKISNMQGKDTARLKSAVGEVGSAFGEVGNMIGSFVTNPITGLIGLMQMAAKDVDDIGKKFGAIGVQKFKDDIIDVKNEIAEFGMGMEDVMTSIDTLNAGFGISLDKSIEMSSSVADVAKSLGISAQESATVLGTFTELNGLSVDQAENLAKSTALLAEANGVAPQQALKDIANSTEVFAKFGNQGAEGLARAAIQARKLGLDLNKVAGSAESMLDFQSSLNAEVEASVMLGRNINLQKARELALTGDLEGFQKEILKQVGGEAEFNKLNILQKKALAKATGLSVTDLTKMVTKQKEQVTLQGHMNMFAEELTKVLPKEAMSEMAVKMAALTKQMMDLATEIGPDLMSLFSELAEPIMGIVRDVSEFVIQLNDSVGIVNLIKGAFAGMIAKSITAMAVQVATTYAKGAAWLGPGTLAALAAAPVVVGGIVAGLKTMAGDAVIPAGGKPMISPAGSPNTIIGRADDDILMAPGIASGVGGGASGAGMGALLTELRAFRQNQEKQMRQHQSSFGVGGTVADELGSKTGDRLSRFVSTSHHRGSTSTL
tara:strand:+ start:356 stop:2368 length:2013 start_codon:yes stop_codon:yes gene_type:complete